VNERGVDFMRDDLTQFAAAAWRFRPLAEM
jgi:hypothetical protein